jgi:uncharacterized protein
VLTDYPWDGAVRIEVTAAGPLERNATLALRIPGWCAGARVRVNGDSLDVAAEPGSYAPVTRRWRRGDVVELDLPMQPRRVYAHPRIAADRGRVALARGPLVYCVEGADHPGTDVRDVVLPRNAPLETARGDAALGSVTTLHARGRLASPPRADLYSHVPSSDSGAPMALTAIPYYAWANREPGPMHVWLRESVNGTDT